MQKSATSARAMEPASPSMTLMTPVGFSTVNPQGRTMHHSRSRPTPPSVKSASWLFLSAKMEDMTVIMSILNMKGACVVFRSGLRVDGVLGVLALFRAGSTLQPSAHVSGQAVAKVLRHLNSCSFADAASHLVLRVARADRGHDRDALDVVLLHRRDDGGRACVFRASRRWRLMLIKTRCRAVRQHRRAHVLRFTAQ